MHSDPGERQISPKYPKWEPVFAAPGTVKGNSVEDCQHIPGLTGCQQIARYSRGNQRGLSGVSR